MIRLIFILILLASAASAQPLPDRYMIEGVAADDVLNIRADPDASSDKIGELGAYTLNVEILRTVDGWGQTPTAEGFGWVSMRFLVANPWPQGQAPRPLICLGTEPFWNLALYPRGAEYNELALEEDTPRVQTIISEDVASNGFLIRTQEGPTLNRTLMVDGRACSDGMSGRPFGMSATLFTSAPDRNYVQTGCCTMQVN